FPAGFGAVVGVQHLADVFRPDDVRHRLAVPARLEPGQVERLAAGPGVPEPDDVHRLGPVPGYQHVARLATDRLAGRPPPAQPGRIVRHGFGAAVETDHLAVVRGGELPRRAVERPVIGALHLRAVAEHLTEYAELVPDPVSHRRDVQRGKG